MPTAPPRLQIDAADAHHTHHQVIVVPRRILPLRRRRIPRPRRLLRCNPCVAGDPDGSSRHHHRCYVFIKENKGKLEIRNSTVPISSRLYFECQQTYSCIMADITNKLLLPNYRRTIDDKLFQRKECPYALAVSTVSGIPIVLLHTSPQLLAPPNPISNHLNARGWKPSWRNGKGRMMTGKLSFHVPGGIMRGFFLMVLSSRRHFSYAGFEQQPKKFVSPKILLLNIEQELKYEKENAEISLHLLKCPIVVKGDNTLAWMMPRFVGFEGKNVEYSTRSAYQIQFLGEIRFIWEGKAEGKCKFFMWLTAQRKILTTDKLQLRG
uniref:Reverse transcriptase zinc-binding domain-containing protein n=1 Tax=Oryza nivara TaxID=4536 RepID=A0A0E0HKH2_ORYNI